MNSIKEIFEGLGAEFLIPPNDMVYKLNNVKAFVFDWDGVFNTGEKNSNGSSSFNEIDSMGTNLLRFSYYLQTKKFPYTALISGEKNESAFFFAKRECFNASYFKIAHKKWAFDHFCSTHSLRPNEICYFFDDVLDLSVAKEAGLRILIARKASTLFTNYVKKNHLADYITANSSGNFAVRESCEMLMGSNGIFDDVITRRMKYDEVYQQYIAARKLTNTDFYTYDGEQIINVDIKL